MNTSILNSKSKLECLILGHYDLGFDFHEGCKTCCIGRVLHIRKMLRNRVMVAGVRTVTLKAECFRPTLRGRSKPAFRF